MTEEVFKSIMDSAHKKANERIDSYAQDLRSKFENNDELFPFSRIEQKIDDYIKKMREDIINTTESIINAIDQHDLIVKAKREYWAKGINLTVNDSKKISMLTSQGKLTFYRKILRPSSKEDAIKLKDLENKKSIVPLDIFFGIDHLPHKISSFFMLEIARIAVNSNSYKDAQENIFKIFGQEIPHEIIRQVTLFIGKIVYDFDCEKADEAMRLYKENGIELKNEIDGTLYIEIDGSFINTRTKNKDGSTWAENKLCMIFNSDNLIEYKDKDGEISYKVDKAEYICLLGSVDEFKKHVLALALRNKYNLYKNVVFLTDGALWIRNLIKELFPGAQQILDIYHLYENISDFLKAVLSDEDKIKKYRKRWYELIEQGEWKKVIKELEKFKDIKLPKGVVNLYNYILDNKDCIDYPYYRVVYKFIGSGAIESGNKYVVKRRFVLGGMMWGRVYVQYVLSLRCKEYSGMWDVVVEIFTSLFPI